MSRYPSDRAIKVQALWDMAYACQITGSHLPDEIGIPEDVWIELMKTEGIHEPHWDDRIRNGWMSGHESLDEYYEFHQEEHKRRLETVDKFQE